MAVNSVASRSNQSYQTLLANYQTALVYSLPERCSYLTQILQDSSVKELQYIFPALIEHIFGFRSGMDWGLLYLDKELHIKEFEALKRFLSPNGAILKLVYKFIEEISPKIEFPLSCIPAPSQLMLKEGKVPALYANKLQIINPGLFPNSLQLNAFEFYFFHFAYFIVNPSLKNSMANVNQQETLYAHLLEEYLCSFLPTEDRAIPLFQTPFTTQHSPVAARPLSSNFGSPRIASESAVNRSFSKSDYLTPVMQKPSLLKKNSIMMVAPANSYGSSQAECWKSEIFLLILKEFLLNQNSQDHQQNVLDLPLKTFVPTHYHVWMVRILVKHLHFFFNNSMFSNHMSGHGQIMIDSLGQLKSLGITQLIQKEMYCYLKCTFDHWPLDASFRVPLETWLSYIQPWRYISESTTQLDIDLTFWQKFVNENVFFYTSLLQLVIKRFLRMDFNCPKNAFMLYRVSKVFAISEVKNNCPVRELRSMIQQAEKACVKPSSLGMSPSYIHRSPEKSYSLHKLSFIEGPSTTYTSLFSEPVYLMVNQLLLSVSTALRKTQNSGIHPGNKSSGIFTKMWSFLDLSFDGSEENSPSDIKKTAMHLEASINHLCSFFKEVNRPVLDAESYMPSETSNLSIINDRSGDSSAIKSLTSHDRYQLINRKRKPEIVCEVNPDLQPVRTFEIASLVTFLNKLSEQLNDEYAMQIQRLYNERTILGKICRKILAKPVTYYSVLKSKDMVTVTRTPVQLPPRIYLRFLANKQLIGCIFAIFLFAYWFGYNPIFTCLIIFFSISLYIFISAILCPEPDCSKNK